MRAMRMFYAASRFTRDLPNLADPGNQASQTHLEVLRFAALHVNEIVRSRKGYDDIGAVWTDFDVADLDLQTPGIGKVLVLRVAALGRKIDIQRGKPIEIFALQ